MLPGARAGDQGFTGGTFISQPADNSRGQCSNAGTNGGSAAGFGGTSSMAAERAAVWPRPACA